MGEPMRVLTAKEVREEGSPTDEFVQLAYYTSLSDENAELREKLEKAEHNFVDMTNKWLEEGRKKLVVMDEVDFLRTANAELTRKVGELRKYTAEILPGLEACGKHGNLINAIHRYLEVTKP